MLYHPVNIGNLSLDGNLFLAPVAGYSDRAFRSLCIKGGSNFEYTEMVSAEALTRRNGKTQEIMKNAPNETKYAVQIFGGTPEVMYDAACLVLEQTQASCIDINAGYPVPKVVKTGAGSALTKNPEQLEKIISAVVKAVHDKGRSIPVTVKIRSGWDQNTITFREASERAINAGASAITLHPRTRAQGYDGKANWDYLAELVQLVKKRAAVFGSGDVFKPEDAKRMLEQTGCDGVMFARGAMGHPFIFRQTRELLETGTYSEIPLKERLLSGFEELSILIEDRGEKIACKDMRKRFCAYSKGIEGGALLRQKIIHAETRADYEKIFAEAL